MPAIAGLGRHPFDPTKPNLMLAGDVLTQVPPPSADWITQVPSLPMFRNDDIGDCTVAGAAHIIETVSYDSLKLEASPTDADVVGAYSAITGYNPADASTDTGATLQSVLDYWQKTGIAGHKITAFAQVDATNLDAVRSCVDYFGSVYTGMWFPLSAMDQLRNGQLWTPVPSKVDGGHCVQVGAYDATSFTCVTWGRLQKMSVDFFQKYFDEVWVAIDLAWLDAQGRDPGQLDTAALNADYQRLTGQPGPFPAAS